MERNGGYSSEKLREPSFELAAEAYTDATGGSVSGSSVRRVSEGFGKRLAEKKEREVARTMEIGAYGESPRDRWMGLRIRFKAWGTYRAMGR